MNSLLKKNFNIKKEFSLLLVFALLFTCIGTLPALAALSDLGKGTVDEPYVIETKADFLLLENLGGGEYVELSDQLPNGVLELGSYAPFIFKGKSFDGKDMTIDVDISGTGSIGLFTTTSMVAEFKNITVTGSIKQIGPTTGGLGGITGSCYGGGITYQNCVNRANLETTVPLNAYSGGIVGRLGNGTGTMEFINCSNYGNITCYPASAGNGGAAGMVGRADGTPVIKLTGCMNYGKIANQAPALSGHSGGIIADIRVGSVHITLSGNMGEIDLGSGGGHAGGIAGYFDPRVAASITKCFNNGVIKTSGSHRAAGIVGNTSASTAPFTISNCFNAKSVTSGSTSYTFAIAANLAATGCAIESCYNVYDGLSIGTGNAATTFSNNYNIIADDGKATLKTSEEMKDLIGSPGISEDDWKINTIHGYLYPQLIGNIINPMGTIKNMLVQEEDGVYFLSFLSTAKTAESYTISFTRNGNSADTFSIPAPAFKIDITQYLTLDGEYEILLEAIGSEEEFLTSDTVTIHYEGMITNLAVEKRSEAYYLTFHGAASASSYLVEIVRDGGETNSFSATTQEYDISDYLALNGAYEITVRPVGGEETVYINRTPVSLSYTQSEGYTPSEDCAISSFSINGYAGVIGANSIKVSLPSGTSVTGLIATFSIQEKAVAYVGSVKQVSGVTKNNFSNGVVYEITAENLDKKSYTVTVEVASSGTRTGGGGSGTVGGGTTVTLPVVSYEAPAEKDPLPENKPLFSDLTELHWSYSYVQPLVEKGILSGYPNDTFLPDGIITREEFMKMTVSAFGFTGKAPLSFEDVSSGAWYYDSIAIAAQNEIIKGVSDTLFGVGRPITREDAAVIIARAAQAVGKNISATNATVFSDVANISDYALEAVTLLSGAGILKGYENGSFLPKNNLTRAEAAYILSQFL